jgi:hypothetical protein
MARSWMEQLREFVVTSHEFQMSFKRLSRKNLRPYN